MLNRIALENQRTQGVMTREQWDLAPQETDPELVGFASPLSIDASGSDGPVVLKIKAAQPFTVSIVRLGYYQGSGARLIETLNGGEPYPAQPQPACLWAGPRATVDCSNWASSITYTPDPMLPSGFYFARLITTAGPATGKGRLVPFLVRDDSRGSAILMQVSDTTWHAYNLWTDHPLHPPTSENAIGAFYYPDSYGGVITHASYARPFTGSAAFDSGYGFERFYDNTYPAIRWLERIGADVSYITGQAVARDYRHTRATPGQSLLLPAVPQTQRLFLTVGHDEYWSQEQRDNLERARAAGVHLMFLSGNQMYWKIGWDGPETMVCEKTSNKVPGLDTIQETFTGRWSDTRYFSSPDPTQARGPENATTGTVSAAMSERDGEILVSPDEGRLRFWRGTPFAAGGSLRFDMHAYPYDTLGHECNFDTENGHRPAGMLHLSSTPMWGISLNYGTGDEIRGQAASYTHHLTLFRDQESGALIFHGGAIDICKALDDFRMLPSEQRPIEDEPPVLALQHGLVNLFADMGLAQPATLPDPSWWTPVETRPAAPSSSLIEPAGPIPVGTLVRIQGQATAASPAQIAAVEIAPGDDGWHTATGTTHWHYWWTPPHAGTFQLRCRAVDDWGTIEEAGPSLTVDVVDTPGYCRHALDFQRLWEELAVEDRHSVMEHKEREVGTHFTSSMDGLVYGVRFYRHRDDNRHNPVNLWLVLSAGPTLLTSAPVASDTTEGWVEVRFEQTIRTLAGATYIASLRSASGFCYTSSRPRATHALTFLQAGYNDAERDRDGFLLPKGSAAGAPLTPAHHGVYLIEPLYRPTASQRCSLWDERGVTPKAIRSHQESVLEPGTEWSSEIDGFLVAARFFTPAALPTYRVSVWESGQHHPLMEIQGPGMQTGVSGWRELTFATPVPIKAGTRYVISYHLPTGVPYGVTDDYFVLAPVSTWPLRGHRGVSPAGPGRPASKVAEHSACYFVDVVFVSRLSSV